MKLILGNGKTAQSIVRFLDKQGRSFKLIEDTREIKNQYALQQVDEILISPGIPPTQDIVIKARAKNIPIISDIELFSRYAKAPIIGITGSNGKSTVTQLLGDMIAQNGNKVAVGGNIGIPALDCLDDAIDFYVLELSSYQLDYTQHLKLITGVALNIAPDHLDRYKSFEDYQQSKLSLYDHCQHPVINLDEVLTPKIANAKYFGVDIPKNNSDFGTATCHGSCYIIKADEALINVDDMPIIGKHNTANALAALALGEQIGLNMDAMTHTLKTFKGLEHRLEWVAKKDNITYYNDSKATNATATIKAINALSGKYHNICLIMGGIKKQEDYAALFELIDKNISNVILIGQSAKQLGNNIHTAKITYANSIQSATNTARRIIDNGTILLSPACASFDMFDDFEHRGNTFKQCVNRMR